MKKVFVFIMMAVLMATTIIPAFAEVKLVETVLPEKKINEKMIIEENTIERVVKDGELVKQTTAYKYSDGSVEIVEYGLNYVAATTYRSTASAYFFTGAKLIGNKCNRAIKGIKAWFNDTFK